MVAAAEVLPEKSLPQLVIKTLSDRQIAYDLDGSLESVGQARQRLVDKELVKPEAITLVSEGKILPDSHLIDAIPSVSHPTTHVKTTTIHWLHMEPTSLLLDPIESAKDWDAKNRLRCFKGVFSLTQRDFKEASQLLVECMATFQDTSFLPFRELVKYAVVSALLIYDRPALDKKIIKSPEVLEVINELAHLKALVESFYLCNYGLFFQTLAAIEGLWKEDWLLKDHVAFMVKELRVRAYAQQLQSYRSLSLASMATNFGVSVEFIDRELSRFIAAGRLNCVIDKVAGVVLTSPPDQRNAEFQAMMKAGDALLNKVQKLSRVITQ